MVDSCYLYVNPPDATKVYSLQWWESTWMSRPQIYTCILVLHKVFCNFSDNFFSTPPKK